MLVTVRSVQSRMTVQERSDAAEMLWRGAVTQQAESSMTKRELAVLPWNSQAVGPLCVLAKAEMLAHQTHPSQSFITHVLAVGGGLRH